MLTPKFWRSIFKDGFIRTHQRGHRTVRNAQYIGGHEGLVKCVGQDRFGNKFYEDLSVDHKHNRRWVEYADFTVTSNMMEDQIAPEWVGWLAGTYDDLPSEDRHFVDHSYIKYSNGRPLFGPLTKLPQGMQHIHNFVDREAFIKEQKERKSKPWEILEQQVSLEILIIFRK